MKRSDALRRRSDALRRAPGRPSCELDDDLSKKNKNCRTCGHERGVKSLSNCNAPSQHKFHEHCVYRKIWEGVVDCPICSGIDCCSSGVLLPLLARSSTRCQAEWQDCTGTARVTLTAFTVTTSGNGRRRKWKKRRRLNNQSPASSWCRSASSSVQPGVVVAASLLLAAASLFLVTTSEAAPCEQRQTWGHHKHCTSLTVEDEEHNKTLKKPLW